ncbi:septal ring lytic transglycosylase RlpA family protein [Limnohabitans sp. Rim8]|uniref:septal ring lytic transglycosylase RlpA family protein n=1 Tax=Limnohabitans sp. Rim8 TaxID=1100718 RepID=UPI003305A5FE
MSHKKYTFSCGIFSVSVLLAVLLLAPLRATGAEMDKPSESIEITDFPEVIKSAVNTTLEGALQTGSAFEAGIASWYGRAFQGRRTASGERFDMNLLTAAHKTLPLGTVVLVRNPVNGQTVEVTINDRGPYLKDRIIDLSYRAALLLGMIQSGKQAVEVHRR